MRRIQCAILSIAILFYSVAGFIVVPSFASGAGFYYTTQYIDSVELLPLNFDSNGVPGGLPRYFITNGLSSRAMYLYSDHKYVIPLYIKLKPSTTGYYVFVSGVMPAWRVGYYPSGTHGVSQFQELETSSYYGLYTYHPMSYFIGNINNIPNTNVNPSTLPIYDGYVYIPPSSSQIYLSFFNASGLSPSDYTDCWVWLGLPSSSPIIRVVPVDDSVSDGVQGVISELQSIKDIITSSQSDDQLSQALVDQLTSYQEKVDELLSSIEADTNRPDPSDIVPDINTDVFKPNDPVALSATQGLQQILTNDVIVTLLTAVFVLILIRYVLYGKD